MSKPEWGTKRMCQSCGVKFYDLRRSPIVCPSCGATFDPEALLRSRRTRPAAVKEEAVKKPVAEKKAAEVKDEDEEAFDADLEDVELDDDADTGDDDLEADESVAQLGERYNGIVEVVGSIPSGSTNSIKCLEAADATKLSSS